MASDAQYVKKTVVNCIEEKKLFVDRLLLDSVFFEKVKSALVKYTLRYHRSMQLNDDTLIRACKKVFNLEIKAKRITKNHGKRQVKYYVLDVFPSEKSALNLIALAIKANDYVDRNESIKNTCKLLREKLAVVNELFNADLKLKPTVS